jgi:hypothetical protein
VSANRGRLSPLIDHLEVCHLLGVKPDTWRKRVGAGSAPLPHSRMGARSYYRRTDVKHFLRHGSWPTRMRFLGSDPSED